MCLPGSRLDDVRKRVGQVMGPGTGGGDLCARRDERRRHGRNDSDRG